MEAYLEPGLHLSGIDSSHLLPKSYDYIHAHHAETPA